MPSRAPWYRFPLWVPDRQGVVLAPSRAWRQQVVWRLASDCWYRPLLRVGLLALEEGDYYRNGRLFRCWPWQAPQSVWQDVWRWHVRTRL